MNNHVKGMLCILAAAFGFSLMTFFVRIKILPKNDHNVISLGALSNIATSGFQKVFWFWVGFDQIWLLPIVGILPRFQVDSVILMKYIN